jgi:hypothetical protein
LSVVGYRLSVNWFKPVKMTLLLTTLFCMKELLAGNPEIFSRFSRMAYNSPTFARPASRAPGGGGPHF